MSNVGHNERVSRALAEKETDTMDNATETLTLIVTECEAGVWYAATLYQSKATKLTLRTGALGLGYVYGVQSRSGLLVTVASRCSGYDVNPDAIEFRPLAA